MFIVCFRFVTLLTAWLTSGFSNYTKTGDNTKKNMDTSVFDKVKTIAVGVLGGILAGGPGQCLGEDIGAKPSNNFSFSNKIH